MLGVGGWEVVGSGRRWLVVVADGGCWWLRVVGGGGRWLVVVADVRCW